MIAVSTWLASMCRSTKPRASRYVVVVASPPTVTLCGALPTALRRTRGGVALHQPLVVTRCGFHLTNGFHLTSSLHLASRRAIGHARLHPAVTSKLTHPTRQI